jgi:hypothetical protein
MKLPRMLGDALLIINAIPGTMRSEVVTTISVVTVNTAARPTEADHLLPA